MSIDNPNPLRRARMDGSEMKDVAAHPDIARFRIDYASGKLYWVEQNNGIIRRSNLDGSQVEDIIADMISWELAIWKLTHLMP